MIRVCNKKKKKQYSKYELTIYMNRCNMVLLKPQTIEMQYALNLSNLSNLRHPPTYIPAIMVQSTKGWSLVGVMA